MFLKIIANKLHSLLLFFVNIFRRALCCIRRRRKSSVDSVPLTHVVSSSDPAINENLHNWEDWENENKPKTVQDHINLYRQQFSKINGENVDKNEEDLNFFEDMTPRITKQTKLYVKNEGNSRNFEGNNRLSCVEDSVAIIPSSELGEWDEHSGWDGENLDADATKVLREKKRQEREKKAYEQYQKRLEKVNKSLGYKLNA